MQFSHFKDIFDIITVHGLQLTVNTC